MEQPDLTKLYNEKIALWMGLKNVCVHPKFGVYEAEDEHGYIDWVDVGIRSLDYHRNWNLLMPVVEKIENTLKEYENKDVSWLYWNNVFDGYVNSKIGITYDSIIGFIEWYNSLTPSLKQFMTKAKIKREDYREIKSYWVSRLTTTPKESCWDYDWVINNPECIRKDFTEASIRNGYSKYAPTHTEQIESITIGTGNPEWGAEQGKLYFVIKYKD